MLGSDLEYFNHNYELEMFMGSLDSLQFFLHYRNLIVQSY